MPAEGESTTWPRGVIWVSNLGLLLFASLGAFGVGPALNSYRPSASLGANSDGFQEHWVNARLWQDPLEAVGGLKVIEPAKVGVWRYVPVPLGWVFDSELAGAGGSAGGGGNSPPLPGVSGAKAPAPTPPRDALWLPVFLSGRLYLEEREQRLRTRAAVLAALATAEFAPEQRGHLRYAVLPLMAEGAHTPRQIALPYEVFLPENAGGRRGGRPDGIQRVCVLWVNEDFLGYERPLGNLLSTLEALGKPGAETASYLHTPRQLAVLGPTTSNLLAAAIAEQKRGPAGLRKQLEDLLGGAAKVGPARANRTGVPLYSPWATAGNAEIGLPPRTAAGRMKHQKVRWVRRNGPVPPAGGWPGTAHFASGFELIRTTADDNALCHTLVEELDTRFPSFRKKRQSSALGDVVIVAERDTLYGRALLKSFKARAWPRFGSSKEKQRRLRSFTYLRGLDGMLPEDKGRGAEAGGGSGGQSSSTAQAGPKKTEADERATFSPNTWFRRFVTQRANGPAQLDTLQRLRERLHDLDLELRREKYRGHIGAIGIFGSDVYDKMLIISALRPEFPSALFFTTEMDAELLTAPDPAPLRNLIVASSYGLRLSDRYQAAQTPFRDGYQAGAYLSCLGVLEAPDVGDLLRSGQAVARPRLFELANGYAYDLSPDGPDVRWRQQPPLRPAEEVGATASPPAATPPPAPSPLRTLPSVHPRNSRERGWLDSLRFWVAGGVFVLILIGCMWVFTRTQEGGWFWRRKIPARDRRRRVGTSGPRPGWLARRWNYRGSLRIRARALALMLLFHGALLGVIMYLHLHDPGSEPLVFFGGISIWPTVILRFGVVAIVLIGVIVSEAGLAENSVMIGRRFFKKELLPLNDYGWARKFWRTLRATPRCWWSWEAAYQPVEEIDCLRKETDPRKEDRGVWFRRRFEELSMPGMWRHPLDGSEWQLWLLYRKMSRTSRRFARVFSQTIFFFLCLLVLILLDHLPFAAARGRFALIMQILSFLVALGAVVGGVFYVLDVTRVCRRWIELLVRYIPVVGSRLDAEHIIQLIGERTKTVGNLIYLPFTALFFLAYAQSSRFDRVDAPLPMLVGIGLLFALCLASGAMLRRTAEHARETSIDFLQTRLVEVQLALRGVERWKQNAALADKSPAEMPICIYPEEANAIEQFSQLPEAEFLRLAASDKRKESVDPFTEALSKRATRLEQFIALVRNIREGAFCPWKENPVLRAALLPFGGLSLISLLEALGRWL